MARARIEVPANFRAASGVAGAALIFCMPYGIIKWILEGFDWGFLLFPVAVILPPCLIWAAVRRRRPSLIVDTEGLDVSGQRIAWTQARLIWVERSPYALVRGFAWVKIVTWSLPSLTMAQRSGYLDAQNSGAVWSNQSPSDIAALIETMAPESVKIRTGPGREAFMKRLRTNEEPLP